MFDSGKVITGLVIFFGLALFPIAYNLGPGNAGDAPVPKAPPGGEKKCIEDKTWMRANHMQLLMDWRDDVVRDGSRVYRASDGAEFNKSLTSECLSCHSNKAEFCDQCHNYLKVKPYCWDCHIIPKESA